MVVVINFTTSLAILLGCASESENELEQSLRDSDAAAAILEVAFLLLVAPRCLVSDRTESCPCHKTIHQLVTAMRSLTEGFLSPLLLV